MLDHFDMHSLSAQLNAHHERPAGPQRRVKTHREQGPESNVLQLASDVFGHMRQYDDARHNRISREMSW